MTTTIEQLIADVLKREGGFVNHPADKGGATNYGITQSTLSLYLGRQCSVADVKAMSKKTAADIYEHQYFIKPSIDKLPDLLLPLVFDMAVNHGTHEAIKMLQDELLAYGYDVIKQADGVLGRLTIGAAQEAITHLGSHFINSLVDRRIELYREIVKYHPSQSVFLNGWINRANAFYIKR